MSHLSFLLCADRSAARRVRRLVAAKAAGTDILVFSNIKRDDPQFGTRIHRALVDAVCDGRLSQQRIEDAYGRIVRLKQQLKTERLPRAR